MKTSYWRKFIEELIEKKYKTKEEYEEGLMAEIKRMLEIIESADFAIEELSTRNIRLKEENKELKEENKELEKIIDRILEENHAIIDGIANGECCQYKALYEKQKQENEELKEDNLRLSEIEDRHQFLIAELTEFKTQLLFLLENKDKGEEV